MNKILKEVIKNIKPTKKEKQALMKKIDEFLLKLNKGLRNAKAILGGSGAKDTWLKGAHDADIFVKFNYNKYKNKSDELSNILEKHLKKVFPKCIRLHGSRDYFQIKKRNFIFEVIPILDIKKAEQAKNITDISPLHSNWVNKFQKLKDEIRLTKAFCKAQSVYGAESYIQGFSGYICEILTIYYGSFLKLIRAAANWQQKVVIDVKRYYKNKTKIFFELNKAKLHAPLIVIDPVQKDRNAAAAISYEKFEKFIKSCQAFLKNPSEKFFEKKDITIEELKKRAKQNKLILIEVKPLKGKEDVIGSKLLKSFKFIKRKLKEFEVIDAAWKWDKVQVLFWYIVDKKTLPAIELHPGPPIYAERHVEAFKKKYSKVFVKNNGYYTQIKRKYRTPDTYLTNLFKDNYFKQKVKSIKLK